jgi:glutathione S-transferase
VITIHHLGVSQSDRIVWACEELGVPYHLKIYERDPQSKLAPPEYRALHPFGTAPVITDGDLVLGESGAIVEYINARYGGNRLAVPASSPHFADYLYWLHFANASLMTSGMCELVRNMLGGTGKNEVVDSVVDRSDRAFDMIEAHLGRNTYFAGPEFSAADVLMLFPLTTMRAFVPRDLDGSPNIRAYLKRIGERPAFKAAASKADPDFKPMLS